MKRCNKYLKNGKTTVEIDIVYNNIVKHNVKNYEITLKQRKWLLCRLAICVLDEGGVEQIKGWCAELEFFMKYFVPFYMNLAASSHSFTQMQVGS